MARDERILVRLAGSRTAGSVEVGVVVERRDDGMNWAPRADIRRKMEAGVEAEVLPAEITRAGSGSSKRSLGTERIQLLPA